MRKFLSCNRGSIIVQFGLSLMPIMLAAGVAIDFSNISRKEHQYQEALDAAVLAAAHAQNESDAKKAGENHFHGHYANVGQPEISFTKTDKGTVVQATLSVEVKNAVMGIVGKPTSKLEIVAQAIAPRKLSSARIRAVTGRGWWDKNVKLMVKARGSSEYVEKARVEYTSPRFSTGIFRVTPSGWIDLGDFEHAYMVYEVDEKSYEFHKWCTEGCPTTLRSDDPKWSHRQFINGKQVPRNTKLEIFEVIPCGKTSRLAWEDGGGHTPDIVFDVEGRCEIANPDQIRLTM